MALPRKANPTLADVEALIASLEQAIGPLRTCRDLSGQVRDEVANLVASIEAPRRAAGNIDALDQMVRTIVNVCTFITPFPVVGPVASRIGDVLGKFVQKPLGSVAKLLRDADKLLMKPVDDELERLRPVFEALEQALHDLGDIIEELVATLQVVCHVGTLLEGLAGVSGNEPAKRQVATALAAYNDAARKVNEAGETFLATVSSFESAGREINKLVPPVRGFLATATGIIFAPINKVLDHLGFLRGICDTARKWLKPFEWLLKKAKWIIERTIGWLFDKILEVLGLKAVVDALKKKVEDLLGITAIRNFANSIKAKLEGLTPDLFRNIADPRDEMLKLRDRIYDGTRSFASEAVQAELRKLMETLIDDGSARGRA